MKEQPRAFDELVPDPQVRKELGGVTEMTTWRWDNNKCQPPEGWQPPVRIGPRKFRMRSTVETVKANLLRLAVESRSGTAA